MKKILIKIWIILFIWISSIWITYAEPIKVIVTESIPWANCTINPLSEWTYICSIEPWFDSIAALLWKIIKYFSFIASIWAVLYIVINWILYSMWWADSGLKEESKKRIKTIMIWLIILLLSWVILNLIAPWIYQWTT